MKNMILSVTRSSIPYIKELQVLTGSVVGCILMQQLDYWFARKPDGFYKFMAPPENDHSFYKCGDSWSEELGISVDEFRNAFDRIGKRHPSRGVFVNAVKEGNEFEGKYYCSYIDKMTNVTYYFRNHVILDSALCKLFSQPFETKGGGESPPPEDEDPKVGDGENPDTDVENTNVLYTKSTAENSSNTPPPDSGGGHTIDELLDAAVWCAKVGGTKIGNLTNYKYKIRSRMRTEGPSADDLENLHTYKRHLEDMERKRQLDISEQTKKAAASEVRNKKLSQYDSLSQEEQFAFKEEFFGGLDNLEVLRMYKDRGFDSPIVKNLFEVWLVKKLS